MEVTLGGNRLGSGGKNTVWMREYERSNHDIGYTWRSTMSAGTLVPFMSEVALPGDNFEIDLDCDVMTHPTIGPLFGSYKVQLDVFQVPIRLYQGLLHMNQLGIGLHMEKILLPQIQMVTNEQDLNKPLDNQQINPSCIFSYLGMRGLAIRKTENGNEIRRDFNAVPYLGYWDIYKNYYANKQEGIGAVIHRAISLTEVVVTEALLIENDGTENEIPLIYDPGEETETHVTLQMNMGTTLQITGTGMSDKEINTIKIAVWLGTQPALEQRYRVDEIFNQWKVENDVLYAWNPKSNFTDGRNTFVWCWNDVNIDISIDMEPEIEIFPLSNIDRMRKDILRWSNDDAPFYVSFATYEPYGLPLLNWVNPDDANFKIHAKMGNQEGLALKTYQSDVFNNWMDTDWIDGVDGISEITKIDTSDGGFTIDELNLNNKIYNMLTRIAMSGGTYDDWLDTVYTHERHKGAENPIYHGGLIKELVFQEVISQSQTEGAPLGELAGRGRLTDKHKGGKVHIRVDEPSYIMGIVSLTPRIDYSQGNRWDTNLKTMNDFHKPQLDEIGFQDLITDQLAWWDTQAGVDVTDTAITFMSAGKQPAWINYMTNHNRLHGNFADEGHQMFMVLNRRYENTIRDGKVSIYDLTTYVDPAKFNHIFADTRRDAQNFWVQIGCDITARRKMSAKVMPNL